MANIRPFRAFRPAMGLEGKVAALPYDVFSREEAREYVKKHPESIDFFSKWKNEQEKKKIDQKLYLFMRKVNNKMRIDLPM